MGETTQGRTWKWAKRPGGETTRGKKESGRNDSGANGKVGETTRIPPFYLLRCLHFSAIRFATVSSHVAEFNARNKSLTARLLQQGYRYHKFRKTFSKFNRRHYELVSKFNVGLKTLLNQGLSEPEFHGDLVFKLKKKKNVGRADFSDQVKKLSYVTNVLDIT